MTPVRARARVRGRATPNTNPDLDHEESITDVLREWHSYWFKVTKYRMDVATPMIFRADRRILYVNLQAWAARARRQAIGKAAAQKAMRGLNSYVVTESEQAKLSGSGKLAKKAREALIPVFYSKPLTALARFPLVRKKHDEAVARVVEAKVLEAELMAEAELPAIGGDGSSTKKKKKKKKKKGDGDGDGDTGSSSSSTG